MYNQNIFSNITPAVKTLLIANIVAFVIATFLSNTMGIDTSELFGLHLPQSPYWRPWQYITYIFIHGGFYHLFSNMFGLFMFGSILEKVWDTRRFYIFFFICGIGAGILNSIIGWFEVRQLIEQYNIFQITPDPNILSDVVAKYLAHPTSYVWNTIDTWLNSPNSPSYITQGKQIFNEIINIKVNIPMVGASGAIFGILLAFGVLFPNTELYLMLIPIPIKAKYFVMGYGVLEIYLGLQQNPGDNVAHFAHIGGMLFGFILLKVWQNSKRTFY